MPFQCPERGMLYCRSFMGDCGIIQDDRWFLKKGADSSNMSEERQSYDASGANNRLAFNDLL
jgi:hypothetical protein